MNDTAVSIALQLAALVIGPLVTALVSIALAQTVGRIKDSRLRGVALEAVMAAQQHLPATSDRYAYAASELARKFPSLKGQDAEIKRLIEAAVFNIKQMEIPEESPAPPAPA